MSFEAREGPRRGGSQRPSAHVSHTHTQLTLAVLRHVLLFFCLTLRLFFSLHKHMYNKSILLKLNASHTVHTIAQWTNFFVCFSVYYLSSSSHKIFPFCVSLKFAVIKYFLPVTRWLTVGLVLLAMIWPVTSALLWSLLVTFANQHNLPLDWSSLHHFLL